MLRLAVVFAVFLALVACVASAPTPLVAETPAIVEPRDLEERATKKKSTKKVVKSSAKKSSSSPAKLYTSTSYSGKATWFEQGGQPGSCGKWNNDNTPLVALNQAMVSSGGNRCGQYVNIKNTANGKTVRAVIADTCPGCSASSLDLSIGAFKAIGNLDSGVLPISWSFA
ncbi:hypothetical protein JCM10212_006952 [Sporobolomyces blumeae]